MTTAESAPKTSTEKEAMMAGRLYRAWDELLVQERLRARELVHEFNTGLPGEKARREELLRELFGSAGPNVMIEPTFRCDYGYNIHVGRNFYANFDCIMLDVTRIDIGDDVLFAPRVQLLTATHPLDANERASGLELGAPIRIGSRVWLGAGVIVCPNVTIGDGSIIGAGSVVTRDIPAHVTAVGNPCRVLRKVDESLEIR